MSDHTVISIDMLYVCYVRRIIYLFFRFFGFFAFSKKTDRRYAFLVILSPLSLNIHPLHTSRFFGTAPGSVRTVSVEITFSNFKYLLLLSSGPLPRLSFVYRPASFTSRP